MSTVKEESVTFVMRLPMQRSVAPVATCVV
jgi:hypothetical protein